MLTVLLIPPVGVYVMIYPLASSDGLHVTLILVRLICSALTSVGGEATEETQYTMTDYSHMTFVPSTVMLAEAVDGLSLATVHV